MSSLTGVEIILISMSKRPMALQNAEVEESPGWTWRKTTLGRIMW